MVCVLALVVDHDMVIHMKHVDNDNRDARTSSVNRKKYAEITSCSEF